MLGTFGPATACNYSEETCFLDCSIYFAKLPNMECTVDFNRKRTVARARVLKALGHPSRLAMVERLAKGETCVCELARLVGTSLSTVSRHLSVLRSAGLVEDRKEGLKVFYRLKCPCILKFLDCVEGVLKTNAREQARLAR